MLCASALSLFFETKKRMKNQINKVFVFYKMSATRRGQLVGHDPPVEEPASLGHATTVSCPSNSSRFVELSQIKHERTFYLMQIDFTFYKSRIHRSRVGEPAAGIRIFVTQVGRNIAPKPNSINRYLNIKLQFFLLIFLLKIFFLQPAIDTPSYIWLVIVNRSPHTYPRTFLWSNVSSLDIKVRSKWRGIKNRSMVCLIRCSRQLKEGGMSETQGQRLFQVCIGRCADNLEQDSSSCCDTLTADIPCVVHTETTSGATSPKISFWVKMFDFKRATVFLCGTPLLRNTKWLRYAKNLGGASWLHLWKQHCCDLRGLPR